MSVIDVLEGLRWLSPRQIDAWRQGRIGHLEQMLTVNPSKLGAAIDLFGRWTIERGLQPNETTYVARTIDRRHLQFTATGDEVIERAYRTHWFSRHLPERQREQLAERQSRPPDLLVVSPLKDWTCAQCGDTGDLLIMDEPGPLCMRCARLDHLVFLGAGDAALTRRAKKASGLWAVVVRYSRSRHRYERRGLLVEQDALARAGEELTSRPKGSTRA